MNKLWTLIFLMICFLLSSCEYVYDYTYQVKNTTDSEISIELETFLIDSVFTISAGETSILLITEHGVEGAKGPYFEDVTFDLNSFSVTKDDTFVSTKDYLDNSSWNFNDGLYSATISNEEFE